MNPFLFMAATYERGFDMAKNANVDHVTGSFYSSCSIPLHKESVGFGLTEKNLRFVIMTTAMGDDEELGAL